MYIECKNMYDKIFNKHETEKESFVPENATIHKIKENKRQIVQVCM